ncbi:MAG TPA: conjugal transfer protein TraR [Caldilineae bacterium]|nr:conjugal transfer protein TraR [Caldilineae bacterium]
MPRDEARLKRMLEAERDRLRAELSHYEAGSRRNLGLGNHMADDGTEAFDQAAGLSLHRNQQRLLEEVERALQKLDNGTYGLCERCGCEIDFARLKAIPYAVYCIHCQSRVEL